MRGSVFRDWSMIALRYDGPALSGVLRLGKRGGQPLKEFAVTPSMLFYEDIKFNRGAASVVKPSHENRH